MSASSQLRSVLAELTGQRTVPQVNYKGRLGQCIAIVQLEFSGTGYVAVALLLCCWSVCPKGQGA